MRQPGVIYPQPIIYTDEQACAADSLAAAPRQQVIRQHKAQDFKHLLDSLAADVDRYILTRDVSKDSVQWHRWEDSVQQHIYTGNNLLKLNTPTQDVQR